MFSPPYIGLYQALSTAFVAAEETHDTHDCTHARDIILFAACRQQGGAKGQCFRSRDACNCSPFAGCCKQRNCGLAAILFVCSQTAEFLQT
ncbi:hypothetical protein DL89DRAFT_23638 [Linderina pennispora]|uniref:Uncharacterized protein n=1 Tax=Linderina pennispora TaxID=61395 RepID=A0A1Y1WMQ9_9FUNG|nr:uncharacterized protein DL89DRAFT_23638 [Linderina pennispora]ORX74849.1 hypothetical protein DL89DRAFT_23638 [Linderina pennispora]